jgi:putative oxidoreductase
MKIVALIARILLGLIFFVFGLNGFLHFIPMKGDLPPGVAGQFVGALMQTNYMYVVSGLQVLGGFLVLINRYTILGLVILGPVIVNIFLFHSLMFHTGLGMACVVVVLWFVLFFHYNKYFSSLFVQKPE